MKNYELNGIPSTICFKNKKELEREVVDDISLLESNGFLIKKISKIKQVVSYTIIKN